MSGCNIGVDIISDILSHSSLRTVVKCRLLCKECNSLTYEPNFTQLHSQRTKTIRGFFIQNSMKDNYSSSFVSIENPHSKELSLSFLPAQVMILSCTKQGLLLCKSISLEHRRVPQFYICKPATKEWQQLPNPKTRYFTQRIALMVLGSNKRIHYKILRLSDPSQFRNLNRKLYDYYSFRCEIFDSENWTWKQLEEIYLPRGEILNYRPAISLNGVFHWLTTKNNIFAFNVHDETWRMLPPPEQLAAMDLNLQLVEYEGKLAIVRVARTNNDCMELWVMEHYGKIIWNKRHTMLTKPLVRKGSDVIPHLEAICNADIALMNDYYKIIFYNFKRGSFDEVDVDKVIDGYGIFPFQSDLEPCKLTRSKTRPTTSTASIYHLPGLIRSYISLSPISTFIFLLIVLLYFFVFAI